MRSRGFQCLAAEGLADGESTRDAGRPFLLSNRRGHRRREGHSLDYFLASCGVFVGDGFGSLSARLTSHEPDYANLSR